MIFILGKSEAVILKLDFEKAYDCVWWFFLCNVLLAEGFDGGYVHRIMQLACGAYTAVSVNGVVGPFFPNGRDLRQENPISPLLFNFVVDSLSCIWVHAVVAGHITPVNSNLISYGISLL